MNQVSHYTRCNSWCSVKHASIMGTQSHALPLRVWQVWQVYMARKQKAHHEPGVQLAREQGQHADLCAWHAVDELIHTAHKASTSSMLLKPIGFKRRHDVRPEWNLPSAQSSTSGSFSSVPLDTVCFNVPHSFCASVMLLGILRETCGRRDQRLPSSSCQCPQDTDR